MSSIPWSSFPACSWDPSILSCRGTTTVVVNTRKFEQGKLKCRVFGCSPGSAGVGSSSYLFSCFFVGANKRLKPSWFLSLSFSPSFTPSARHGCYYQIFGCPHESLMGGYPEATRGGVFF